MDRLIGFIPAVGLPIRKVVYLQKEGGWLRIIVHPCDNSGDVIKGKFPRTEEGRRLAGELAERLLGGAGGAAEAIYSMKKG